MAFTEQGVAMLSSVLRSSRAVQVNIAIMRTFVRLREMLLSNAELARKLSSSALLRPLLLDLHQARHEFVVRVTKRFEEQQIKERD